MMGKSKGGNGYEKWVRIANKNNGYLGLNNWESADDKITVEVSVAQDWLKSMSSQFGLEVGHLKSNREDPPDFFVQYGSRQLGVELMLMIERAHLERAARGELTRSGQLFIDMQWTKERLATKLNECLDSKHRNYSSRGVHIDILILFSPEKWLCPQSVKEWLAETRIEMRASISSAFLLLDYQPNGIGGGDYPVFAIYDSIFEK